MKFNNIKFNINSVIYYICLMFFKTMPATIVWVRVSQREYTVKRS